MRQLGWLHAAPKPPETHSKTAKRSTNTSMQAASATTSRVQKMQAQGIVPEMPDPGPAAYLVDWLFDAGPVSPGGMGPGVLAWADMSTWARINGIALQPWEARTLRHLSGAYIAASREGEAHDAPAPYSTEPTPEHRDRISQRLRAIFGGMAARDAAAAAKH